VLDTTPGDFMTRPLRERKTVAAVAAFALLAGLLVAVAPLETTQAEAADLTSFDPGFIISDEIFYNSGTMTSSSIQSFLEAKDRDCADYYLADGTKMMCIQDYSAKVTARDANSNCAAIADDSSATAAEIIYLVSQACGVNPQVILVLIQKEEDLILAPHSSGRYKIATGYGCPDTAACSSKYYGFYNQVWNAANSFKQWSKPITRNYMPGRYNSIKYHPNSKCGTSSVYIRNYATAALYMYTPYVPNSAALSAGYGLGNSCSSYGNRNFYNFFSDWFGNPGNLLSHAGFERSYSGWKSGVKSVGISLKHDAANAQSGSYYVSTHTSRSGSSMRQTINKTSVAGDTYVATIWVKALSDTDPYVGVLKLSAVGGSSQSGRTDFTAGPEWSQVQVTLPVTSRHTKFYFDIYEKTTGISLAVDSTSLVQQETDEFRAEVKLSHPSFEGSTSGWARTTSKVSYGVRSAATGRTIVDGKYIMVAKTKALLGTIQQDVPFRVVAGRTYTASVWLRTSGSQPFEGALVLRGTGGKTDSARTDFSVGSEWQRVQVSYTATRSGLKGLRFEIRMNTLSQYLHVDDVHLLPNLASDASFESGGLGGWNEGAGTATTAVITGGNPHAEVPDGTRMFTSLRTSDGVVSYQLNSSRTLEVGDTYTATIYLRATNPDVPIAGSIRLWALGGDGEHTSTSFSVGSAWTTVQVELPITVAGDSSLRFEIYNNTPSGELAMDGLWIG
jgi:hypothetical protein